MTPGDPGGLPPRGPRRVADGLVAVFLRDTLVNSVGMLSFVVVLVGIFSRSSPWGVAAVVVGALGLTLPWLSMWGRLPMSRLRWVVYAAVVADLAVLTATLFGN
jgi:hypothetical protein